MRVSQVTRFRNETRTGRLTFEVAVDRMKEGPWVGSEYLGSHLPGSIVKDWSYIYVHH